MKPLVPALLLALAFMPALSRAQSVDDLKKKYAHGGQKPADPPAAAGPDDAAAQAAGRADDGAAKPPAPAGGMPALRARPAKGAEGYTLSQLSAALDATGENLGDLIDYVHPYEKGATPPAGDDSVRAHKAIASEISAAKALIAEGDAELAKGVQRDPPAVRGHERLAMLHPSRAGYLYSKPTEDQKLEAVATELSNVAGHMSSVLDFKRMNPPDAHYEAAAERFLEEARKELAAQEKRAAAR